MSTTPTLPIIHMNGTSRIELVRAYTQAIDAVQDAINEVQASAPNWRDYYQVDDLMHKAVREHIARVTGLVKVRDELMEIAQGVRG